MKSRLVISSINRRGLTLIEVLIAITILAFFLVAVSMSLSSEMKQSVILKDRLILDKLAENYAYRLFVDPPDLNGQLEALPMSGDIEGYAGYRYQIFFQKMKLDKLDQIIMALNNDGLTETQISMINFIQEKINQSFWIATIKVQDDQGRERELVTWLSKGEGSVL